MLTICVIMPVHNGADCLPLSLPPLLRLLKAGDISEVIVVDDNSTDETVEIASRLGARIIQMETRSGPAAARNRAALETTSDVLWFVDADVVVEEGVIRKIREAFSDITVSAVFGTYNDRPAAMNFLSQYKNLVHHYYHMNADSEASTFWSGCGAIRNEAFNRHGGFDLEKYKFPSIEDIDLGYRITASDERILLLQDLQCTHLKKWTFFNLVHTEIFRRAVPWSRLILADNSVKARVLNVNNSERIKAVCALMLLPIVLFILNEPSFWILLVAWMIVVILINQKLLQMFSRERGMLFAFRALLFHQFYYAYSALSYASVYVEKRVVPLFSSGTESNR